MVVEEQDIGLDSRVSRLEGIAEQVNLRLEDMNSRMNCD